MKTTEIPQRIKIENQKREVYDELKDFDSLKTLIIMICSFYPW